MTSKTQVFVLSHPQNFGFNSHGSKTASLSFNVTFTLEIEEWKKCGG
jgi:hypothetical protein